LTIAVPGLFLHHAIFFSLAGVLISSPLTAAKGFKPAITLGSDPMLGIGFALLNAADLCFGLAASAIYGLATVCPRQERICGVGESYGSTPCLRSQHHESGLGRGCDFVGAARYELPIRASRVTLLLYIVGAICLTLAIFFSG